MQSIKGLKMYSILRQKCPVCHEGAVYETTNPYHPKKFDKMHTTCTCCGHKYELEAGFFYGAMYVSYGIAVAIAVSVFVGTYVLFPAASHILYIINIISGLLILMPVNFRVSRIIWMNLFSSYGKRKNYNT